MVSGGLIPLELFEEEPGFARLLDGLRAARSCDRVRPARGGFVGPDRGLGAHVPTSGPTTSPRWWTRRVPGTSCSWPGMASASARGTRRCTPSGCRRWCSTSRPSSRTTTGCHGRNAACNAARPTCRGEEDILAQVAPSRIADRAFREWYARAGRLGASPSTAPAHLGVGDARASAGRSPTSRSRSRRSSFTAARICSRPPDLLTLAAERIPHATLIELEGRDHFPFVGDVDAVVAEIAAFVVGERRLPAPQRLLSAVLFTDLVGSTERASSLGDEDWKSVLDRHDATIRADRRAGRWLGRQDHR